MKEGLSILLNYSFLQYFVSHDRFSDYIEHYFTSNIMQDWSRFCDFDKFMFHDVQSHLKIMPMHHA